MPPRAAAEIIQEVVKGAKDKQVITLAPGELSIMAAKSAQEMLKDRANQMLKTQQEFNKLKDILKDNRELYEDATDVKTQKNEIEKLEQELEVIATGKPKENAIAPVVSDILSENPAAQKSIPHRIKEFFRGIPGFGAIVQGYVSLKRMMMDFFPPENAAAEEKQLAAIDRLYGSWFGCDDARKAINTQLQGKNLSIVEGTGDDRAYAKLKLDYRNEAMEAYSFEQFIQEQADKYHTDRCTDTGKKYVTTLKGISNSEKPKEKTA